MKDRKEFMKLIEDVSHVPMKQISDKMPMPFRNLLVRTICTATGEKGSRLRDLWVDMYAGDLRWGPRDVRMKAKASNWPEGGVTSKQDRNSWVAAYIRQGFMTEVRNEKKRLNEKKNQYDKKIEN